MDKQDYLSWLASLGCIICSMPAEIHHLTGAGMALKNPDERAIPLCPRHHRLGGYGVAVHAGVKTWERNYGTQEELLAKIVQLKKARKIGRT